MTISIYKNNFKRRGKGGKMKGTICFVLMLSFFFLLPSFSSFVLSLAKQHINASCSHNYE